MVTTRKQRIIQNSNLVDELWFLVPNTYNGYNMDEFNAQLEYILPISERYRNEPLVRSDNYNNYLKYILPINSDLTQEAGDIELKISFTRMEMVEPGHIVKRVRKISPTTITVTPIESWDGMETEGELDAVNVVLI